MWHDALIMYLWFLLWASGPAVGNQPTNAHPDGQVMSGMAQAQDPNVANSAPGPNGNHSQYPGNSGSAPPNGR